MIVILTEKPSVARDFANYFKAQRKEGFFLAKDNQEYQKDIAITWAYGHLLKDRQFEELPKKWSFENMPIFPETFSYKPNSGSANKQLKVIKGLINNNNVTVINAGDPAREGELIQRLILDYLNYNYNSYKRFWVSEALTENVIKKGLGNLINGKELDSLYESARARQHADWLMGINLTRGMSIQGGGKYSVGRVQTPVLRLIAERNKNVKNFIKSFHYSLLVNAKQEQVYGIELELEGKEEKGKDQAKELMKKVINNPKGMFTEIQKENKTTRAPNPHSLTSLQQEANKAFGMTAARTLEVAQSLYEKHKAISYPRTDSQYLGENTKEDVLKIAGELNISIEKTIEEIGKDVFNNARLTDHHAIIPLINETGRLTEEELNIYRLVKRRFEGIFKEDCLQKEILILANWAGVEFSGKQSKTIKLGWKKLYSRAIEARKKEDTDAFERYDKAQEGTAWIEECELKEIEKKPKKQFTEASILSRMKSLNLGTPATRADILEKLINMDYIQRENKNLISTEKGSEFIEKTKERNFTSPELTAQWENKLTQIEDNKLSYNQFIQEVKDFTRQEIEILKTLEIQIPKNIIGDCACGGELIGSSKAYSCESCGRIVWKQTFGTTITQKQALDLLGGKAVNFKKLKSKAGKEYEATLHFNNENKLTFKQNFGTCQCGGKVKGSSKAYSCESCGRIVWKQTFGTTITQKQALDLLGGKAVNFKKLKSKAGKEYEATLHFDKQNKLTFKK